VSCCDYASSRPSSGNCHVCDKVLAETTIDEANVWRKQNKLMLINNRMTIHDEM
jgi:hypothetical protein